MNFFDRFEQLSGDLHERLQFRHLEVRDAVDFCSNDYLSFAGDQELQKIFIEHIGEYPIGSSSSRLVRGHSQALLDFEVELAIRGQRPAALFFPSGYQANLALWSSLAQKGSIVFSDQRIHASVIDGLKLSKCQKVVFPHNDMNFLEEVLAQNWSGLTKYIAVDSVYSMTGTQAPLHTLVELSRRHGAHLVVDEAHASGLFGKRGMGLVEELGLTQDVFATMHTGGKAFGGSGAWVSGPQELIEYLVNFSRPFIYSTAPSFPQWLQLKSALSFWDQQSVGFSLLGMVALRKLRKEWLEVLPQHCFFPQNGLSPILPVRVGDNMHALSVAEGLYDDGLDVRAIRPPTVPVGESLLRITMPLARTDQEIELLKQSLIRSFQ